MGSYPYNPGAAFGLIASAGNIQPSINPPYTQADFFTFYPQFDQNVPGYIVDQFIAMAQQTVMQTRWFANWQFGMALFVAHFCTLYMQATGPQINPTAAQVITTAQTRGLQTSKSVGEVSVSYDFSQSLNGLDGWAMWTSTTYGAQFATMARMLSKAGSYVW